LTPKYQKFIDAIDSTFEIWSDNNSGSIYFKYSVALLEFNFVFWRNSRTMAIGLDHLNGDKGAIKAWFNKNLNVEFPEIIYNGRKKYGFLNLYTYKFTDEEIEKGEDYINQLYQDKILETINKLSVLENYYSHTKQIVIKMDNFLNKLEQQLLGTFTKEKDWNVTMGNVKELKRYQPISITNSQWGEGRYKIYISSLDSYFNKPCIGVISDKDFKNANAHEQEALYDKLAKEFDNADKTSQSFFRSIIEVKQPINGNMYTKLDDLGHYNYDENDENESIKIIVKSLAKLTQYTSEFTKLANTNR
jgi:hypothetical protein